MTHEELLRARIGRDTLVDNGTYEGRPAGWGGAIIEVGREADGRLYADVDYGYRFYVDESSPLTITEPDDPQPLGDWVRETHPHLFEKGVSS